MLPGPSLSSLVSVCVSGSFFWTSALRGPETSFRSSSGSHMSSFPTREDELSPHHLPPFAPSLCLSRLKIYIYIYVSKDSNCPGSLHAVMSWVRRVACLRPAYVRRPLQGQSVQPRRLRSQMRQLPVRPRVGGAGGEYFPQGVSTGARSPRARQPSWFDYTVAPGSYAKFFNTLLSYLYIK